MDLKRQRRLCGVKRLMLKRLFDYAAIHPERTGLVADFCQKLQDLREASFGAAG